MTINDDIVDGILANLRAHGYTVQGTEPPPPPPPPPVDSFSVTAKVLSPNSVEVDWVTDNTDITGWTAGRDGVDSNGTGEWTSALLGAAVRKQVFSSLLPNTQYTFTVKANTPAGILTNTVTANTGGTVTPPPPPPPPPTDDDGTQAAITQNWGTRIAGDEFDTGNAPGTQWGMYDGPGHNGNGIRSPSAFSIANGELTCHGDAGGTTGGMAYTQWSATTYRVEVRAKMEGDGSPGEKYHFVALIMWPNSDAWPSGGEDDVCEGDIGDGGVQWFIHHPNQNDGGSQSSASWQGDITQYHNYAIERSGSGVKIFVDGQQVASYTLDETNGQVPGPMHPTIQLDNFGGSPHQPADLKVKWLRIYTRP